MTCLSFNLAVNTKKDPFFTNPVVALRHQPYQVYEISVFDLFKYPGYH